jgi:hypothetical protein
MRSLTCYFICGVVLSVIIATLLSHLNKYRQIRGFDRRRNETASGLRMRIDL